MISLQEWCDFAYFEKIYRPMIFQWYYRIFENYLLFIEIIWDYDRLRYGIKKCIGVRMIYLQLLFDICTVEWRNIAVQYNMIFHTTLHWLTQNMNQTPISQNTFNISPSRASYGVSNVWIWRKFDRAIAAPHCICFQNSIVFRWGRI